MSGYVWQGSGQHGGFVRAGNRNTAIPGDKERGQRLFELLAGELFWCERCHGRHPLAKLRLCQ